MSEYVEIITNSSEGVTTMSDTSSSQPHGKEPISRRRDERKTLADDFVLLDKDEFAVQESTAMDCSASNSVKMESKATPPEQPDAAIAHLAPEATNLSGEDTEDKKAENRQKRLLSVASFNNAETYKNVALYLFTGTENQRLVTISDKYGINVVAGVKLETDFSNFRALKRIYQERTKYSLPPLSNIRCFVWTSLDKHNQVVKTAVYCATTTQSLKVSNKFRLIRIQKMQELIAQKKSIKSYAEECTSAVIDYTMSHPFNEESSGAPTKLSDQPLRALDLVFVMDCTGSMGSYIEAAKQNIQNIIHKIITGEKCDVRFGLVAYRDHPPQDYTFVTKTFEFTSRKKDMTSYLNSLSASGGGDGPEAVTAALYATEQLSWRENAAKVAILIADAPPHGLGGYDDGFPEGDPDGRDPLEIARSMASKGITVYTVACEPSLGGFLNARAFMVAVAQITHGQAVSLSSSALLANVILCGASEELGIQSLQDEFKADIDTILKEVEETIETADEEVIEAEVSARLHMRMQENNVRMSKMNCDGKLVDPNGTHFVNSSSLREAREKLNNSEVTTAGRCVHFGATYTEAPPSTSATLCTLSEEAVSMDDCRKMYSRSKVMRSHA